MMHKKESSFVQGDDRRVGEPKFRVIKCIRWPDRVDAIYVTLYNVVHNSTQSVLARVGSPVKYGVGLKVPKLAGPAA